MPSKSSFVNFFNLGLEKVKQYFYLNQRMKVIGEETVLVYADYIVILGNTKHRFTYSLSKLLEANKIRGAI